MDRISINGIECKVRLGVPAWERKKPQKVLLDIELELPLAKAGVSDNVRDTVDYWAVEKLSRRVSQSGEYHLTERLAFAVGRAVLSCDRRIRKVLITVHKHPKVMPKTREVVVSISVKRK